MHTLLGGPEEQQDVLVALIVLVVAALIEGVSLAQAIRQVRAERDRPDPDHRMPPFAGAGAGQRLPSFRAGGMQPGHKSPASPVRMCRWRLQPRCRFGRRYAQ